MTDPTLPAEARREILREYGHRDNLRVFIESGTADGATPAALMADFDWLYTIERDQVMYEAALARFDQTNVTCLYGDSAEILPPLLATMNEPALLWLDGHRCSGESGPDDTPVLAELAAAFDSEWQHTVLVDDARLFGGMSGAGEWNWPDIKAVEALALGAGYHCVIADDIIRLTPK